MWGPDRHRSGPLVSQHFPFNNKALDSVWQGPTSALNHSHAFVADLEALRPHGLGDGPKRLSLASQRDHFADRLLLTYVRN
jgi:hypothetical protein